MHYFIYGTTDLAENLFYLLTEDNREITGFVVERKYITDGCKVISFKGAIRTLPVIPFEELEIHYKKEEIAIYLCIGYTNMNRARREKFMELKKRGYRIENYIHKTACVETDKLGEGNLIFEQAYIGMYAVLGNGNIVYPKALIAHHSKIGDFNYFAISTSVAGHVTVSDENFFGNNATTRDKIKIGNGNLIGANAYVQHDLSDENVIVPERSIILKNKKPTFFL
ncbi:MAG: acetyltransferase [Lachnospiraceae bacterium]|nr:acetyltransferase [Lachnospiraceae bacterium]